LFIHEGTHLLLRTVNHNFHSQTPECKDDFAPLEESEGGYRMEYYIFGHLNCLCYSPECADRILQEEAWDSTEPLFKKIKVTLRNVNYCLSGLDYELPEYHEM
jgi:hypothetical protein